MIYPYNKIPFDKNKWTANTYVNMDKSKTWSVKYDKEYILWLHSYEIV